MAKLKYFEVYRNKLNLLRDFPKKMSKKRALELSIQKWEGIVAYYDDHDSQYYLLDRGKTTCALCHKYWDKACMGCPIAEVAAPGCTNIVYDAYRDAFNNSKAEEAAKAEFKFLQDLYAKLYPAKESK